MRLHNVVVLLAMPSIVAACTSPSSITNESEAELLQAKVMSSQLVEDIDELTREVALALGGDAALRQRVRASMLNSPYAEGQLEFRRIMADDEVGLANRMPSSLVGILERIPPQRCTCRLTSTAHGQGAEI